jgi:hypothetical protein
MFTFTVAAVVLIGGIAILAFAAVPNNGAYGGAIIFGLGCWLLWSVGISSKVVINADCIRVDNFLVSHIVSWKDYDSFVLDSGIELTKRDGSRVSLLGFGGSLVGALTGYRSFRNRLVILQQAANRYRNAAGFAASHDRVRLGLPVLAGWLVAMEAAVLVTRAFH